MADSLGHMKDLFECESATLRTHWVLVVMDQGTRRIIGFGVHAGTVDGVALCRLFNRAIQGQRWLPNYLGPDNDPLYRFQQWQANLRILEVFRGSDSPRDSGEQRIWPRRPGMTEPASVVARAENLRAGIAVKSAALRT